MIKLLVIARSRKANDRFWRKVSFNGPVPAHRPELGPCWIWRAARDKDGYGLFQMAGKCHRAHRVAYELLVGPLTERDPSRPAFSITIDHLCRNRACVNPGHMEMVPNAENIRRGTAGKMSGLRMSAKEFCPAGHPYSGPNLYVGPDGKRRCRACNRASHGGRMKSRRKG